MAETRKKTQDTKSSRTRKKTEENPREKELYEKKVKQHRIKDEVWAIVIIALGVFFAIALQTSAAGQVGTIIKDLFCGLFGKTAVILPYYLIVYGVLLLFNKTAHLNKRSILLLSLTFLMIALMYSNKFVDADKISFEYIALPKWFLAGIEGASGGAIGMFLAVLFLVWFGTKGLYIFAIVIILICLLLLANTPISQFIFNYKTKKSIRKQIEKEEAEAEAELLKIKHKELEEQVKLERIEKERKAGVLPTEINPKSELSKKFEPMIKEAKANEKKKNILSYMLADKKLGKEQDKKLEEIVDLEASVLEATEKSVTYGLEPAASVKTGYGVANSYKIESPNSKVTDESLEKKTLDEEAKRKIWAQVPKIMPGVSSPEFELDKFNSANTNEELYGFDDEILNDQVEDFEPLEEVVYNAEPEVKTYEATQIEETEENADLENAEKQELTYSFPPIDLLIEKKPEARDTNKAVTLATKAEKLEQTLRDFKVDAKVTNVTQGPAVTRYEVQPNTGVKVNSIVKLSDDIALNMEAKSIRIEAPIPGKPAVGIEIENESIKMIRIREIIGSKNFEDAKSKISFAVGQDIEGNAVVADLKSMPHMLIAGSTGSGKSVCINSIIVSLIYKAMPSEVKLVLIDPKVVELGIYNGIPHMLIPVVTEPSKAAAALNWAVAEMNTRYKKFASASVRDLESYNKAMQEKAMPAEKLPQIVIIIDELADLMMAAPSQVEDSICRLAQMARAAGMHLIVATQRPSVDVVTGVIKANIPSRIAFAVSSQFDSRTILDMAGAEKLVGKGDMLFYPMGYNKPIRVQGNFISDEEVNAVINYLKEQGENEEASETSKALIASLEQETSSDNAEKPEFEDELMPEAIEAVLKAEQASTSMLQRRFRIGYNRAARMIDDMENMGLISEADGSRPRTVNVTYEEYFADALQEEEENDNYLEKEDEE